LWTPANDSEDLTIDQCRDTGEAPDCGGMRAVTWTGSQWVAVGYAFRGDPGRSGPIAWTSPNGLDWTLAANGLDFGAETANDGGWLSDVTVGGPGLVAVGSTCTRPCNTGDGGLVYTSVDGTSWDLTPFADAPAVPLSSVASIGDRTFAVGVLDPGSDVVADLQLWRADDGAAWQRESSLPTIADAQSYMSVDLAAVPDRMVIGGWAEVSGDVGSTNFAYASPPFATPSTPSPSAAPSSPAPVAVDWQRAGTVPVSAEFFGGEAASIRGVVATGDTYLAVGHDRTGWSSADGVDWSDVDLPFEASKNPSGLTLDANVDAIASDGRRVVVVGAYAREPCARPTPDVGGGHLCPRSPISWISDDGRDWRSSHPWKGPTPPAGYEQGGEFASVWSVPTGGWDAVLGYWQGAGLTGFDIWHSDDGVNWTKLAPVPESFVQTNESPLGIADSTGRRLIWEPHWSYADGVPTSVATLLATSVDGRTWETIGAFPSSGAVVRSALAPRSPGEPWILVGSFQAGVDQPSTPTAWMSTDLEHWTTATLSVGDAPPDVCTAVERPNPCKLIDRVDAVARTAGGYLAVGSFIDGHYGYARSSTWQSPDGVTWVESGSHEQGMPIIGDGPAGLIAVGVPDGEQVVAVWRLPPS
jgi:hypothetical protein